MDLNYNLPNNGGSSPSCDGCVRYDEAQGLTDEQKARACLNIGAGTGEKGDKGDKGDTGETGQQGPQGPQGEPGTGTAENHQLLKDVLSEPLGCQAGTWNTLCQVTAPEDGAYQVSASVRARPDSESAYGTASARIEVYGQGEDPTEHQEIEQPRSGEYGTMSVPVNARRGQKIRLSAYSSSNFYAEAAPSAGKASATFIAAVRIGAIHQTA